MPESNVAAPSQQAPASAPAGSDANFPTGLVERLPSSAYPEPVIRGLYGSSLWLDMQGHQWPYYPRIGVGVSGYGWVDTDYKRTRIGDVGQSDHTTKLFGQGRFALRVTPTYSNGSWFVQAQAELIANLDQLDPQPQVADTDDLWVRTGVWKSWDVTVGRFEGVLRLPPGHGPGPQHRRAHRRLRQPRPRLGPAAVSRELPLLPAPGPAEHGAAPLFRAAPPRRAARPVGQQTTPSTRWAAARRSSTTSAGSSSASRAEYQWLFAQDPAPTSHNESRNRGVAGSMQFVFAPWVEFGPNIGRAVTDVFTNALQPDGSFALDTSKSGDIWSYGGFLNFRPFGDMLIGAGGNFASFANLHVNANGQHDQATNTQYFLAAPVPRSPPAVREGGRRLRQDALRLQLQQHDVRRRHVQLPRPPDVPVLRCRRAVRPAPESASPEGSDCFRTPTSAHKETQRITIR